MEMVRQHPLELLLIAIPIFRPLRLLRVLRVFAGTGAAFKTVSRIADRKGLQWFLVLAVTVIGVSAVLMLLVERDATAAEIRDIGDALWWAVVTCTTVGYGDVTPVTPAGRTLAVLLMGLGISIVSVITANIASVLVEQDTESDLARLESKIDSLTTALSELVDQGRPPHRTSELT